MPAYWRRQQDMHQHVFPIIVDHEVVHWQPFATCTYGTQIDFEGQGASADALTTATEHAPARIPNRRRLLAGALAQHLQHVRMVNICIVIEGQGASAGALARHQDIHRHVFQNVVLCALVRWQTDGSTYISPRGTYASLVRGEG